jgi:heme/copper-type cytochrome/quinol oxidase subunit 2
MREIITILSAIVLGVTLITLIFSVIIYILFRLRANKNKKEVINKEIKKEPEEEIFIRYQPKEGEKD